MRRKTIMKGNAQREPNPLAPRIIAIIEHLAAKKKKKRRQVAIEQRKERRKTAV